MLYSLFPLLYQVEECKGRKGGEILTFLISSFDVCKVKYSLCHDILKIVFFLIFNSSTEISVCLTYAKYRSFFLFFEDDKKPHLKKGPINPYLTNVPISYHLKTPENLWKPVGFCSFKKV